MDVTAAEEVVAVATSRNLPVAEEAVVEAIDHNQRKSDLIKSWKEGIVFDLGERLSADPLRTTQIKIAQYIGSQYGGDIMGELEMKKEFVAAPPQYPASAIQRQPDYKAMI